MRLFDSVSLKVFVSVCEEKSIEVASRKEGMVRSAVSKRISAMEEIIGTRLLDRRQRGVEVTPAGEALARYARDILRSMERINTDVRLYSSDIQGNIKIACAMSGVGRDLMQDIACFLRQHDKVHVSAVDMQIADVVHAVNEHRVDFGLCIEGSHTRYLNCIPYRSENLHLVVPIGHRLAGRASTRVSEILDYDVVDIVAGFQGSVVSSRLRKEAAAVGKDLRSRIQVGTFDAAFHAVTHGLGVTVTPAGLADHHAGLVEVPIEDSWTHRRLVICTEDPPELSDQARLLINSLTAFVDDQAGASLLAGRTDRQQRALEHQR
jgi:DNA-binding transcriptional LysR family regulator